MTEQTHPTHMCRFDACEACGRFRELVAREMYLEERDARELGMIDLGGECGPS